VIDIVHMTCRSVGDDAQSDLKPVAELLFSTSANEDGLYLHQPVHHQISSSSLPPLSPSITFFHSRLETYLFHKSCLS